jgi:hypothetical protein
VGVVLVRNEDRFLGQALRNAEDFCDSFLLFDHASRDRSMEILAAFASGGHGRSVRRIRHPRESHDALQPLVGSRTWVFGVDGDEVYDPEGLGHMRQRLLAGEFDDQWMVMGNCLHASEAEGDTVGGYLAPPSRSITKLYNFAAIESWRGRSLERLHGGTPVFRPGYSDSGRRMLHHELSWNDSPLRCLHLCFCRRSSIEAREASGRRNIAELYGGWLPAFLVGFLRRDSAWKRERYQRGEVFDTPHAVFFPNGFPQPGVSS